MKLIISPFIIISKLLGHPYPDTGPHGAATHSSGVVSGNSHQVPVHVPVEVCGNLISVAVLNPALDNSCAHG
jgi:hypothetical protein